jgi:hypothetical protein
VIYIHFVDIFIFDIIIFTGLLSIYNCLINLKKQNKYFFNLYIQ